MKMLDFEPLASPDGAELLGAGSRECAAPNVDRFAPVLAQRLRFTVLATNENNRYEPCLDELEVFTAGPEPRRNVALAGAGAKVSASGTYPNSAEAPPRTSERRGFLEMTTELDF